MQPRDQRLDPLNGYMDTRSPAGTRDPSVFRLVVNMDGSEAISYCRLGGWRRLSYQDSCYLNQDLHDQMLCGQTYSLNDSYTVEGYTVFLGTTYGSCQATTVPGYTLVQGVGDYCGYAPYAPFPQQQVIGSPFICNQFIGWPYYTAPTPLTNGTGKNTWEVEARTNPSSWENGKLLVTLSWWSDSYGPGEETQEIPNQSPDILTHVFEFCIPQDAVNVQVALSFGDILDGPTDTTVECEPAPTEWPCVTEGPDFYRLSTYSLCTAEEIPGYTQITCDGTANPIYQDFPKEQIDYCRGMFLLGRQCREAITLLYSFKSRSGSRRLIAGTMSRLYVNNERGGNWRILADNLGGACHKDEDCECSPKRCTVAQLGDIVIFTNGIDPVLVWTHDEGPEGCFNWSADYLPDLLALNITTARVCGAYQGFLFIGDVTADNERLSSRLHWCDFNNPLHWAPGGESLAGFQDFGRGETILSIQPIGGKIRVYTDKAVYDGIIVADSRLFSFQEVYRGDRVPIFRHSLVNTGEAHYFLGENAVFRMAEYDREPTPFDWMNLSAGPSMLGWTTDSLRGCRALPVTLQSTRRTVSTSSAGSTRSTTRSGSRGPPGTTSAPTSRSSCTLRGARRLWWITGSPRSLSINRTTDSRSGTSWPSRVFATRHCPGRRRRASSATSTSSSRPSPVSGIPRKIRTNPRIPARSWPVWGTSALRTCASGATPRPSS
jgi:hypothetical protein